MGQNAQIWRDDRLRGNDAFTNEIMQQLRGTAAMVSVLTPRYAKSEWCTKEVAGFCDVAEETGGVVQGNKARVFKVLKTPLDAGAALPQILNEMLGYEFYELDAQHTPRELDPEFGQDSRREFLRKVNQLAWDIKQLLSQLTKTIATEQLANHSLTNPVVYIAECSHDRKAARESLAAELSRYGYSVLPKRELPREEGEYVAEVRALLAQCALSVHLVGTGYGLVPDGLGQKSAAMLQNELAVERCKSAAFQRVIWLPDGTQSSQPQQQAFISALRDEADAQFGADLINGDFEGLRAAVQTALKKLEKPLPSTSALESAATLRTVYVLCDERDRSQTLPLLKALKGRGFDVRLPVFTGDASSVRSANQELLSSATAVVLFYGAGDEAWKYHQQNELKKQRGLRSLGVPYVEYTYLALPDTEDKKLLADLGEPRLIDARAGLTETHLHGLLRDLSQSQP